ncbi:MAG: polysaccharide pyruvyl transferase family protein, partial [Prevotellaceae bacterium]|nr:polysaccharide pyruvyl transferase family protein [Prevotellaceae bacterium]
MYIAILTVGPPEKNYGGILQCLALQNLLKDKGHIVDVIRFRYEVNNGVFRKIALFVSLVFNKYGSFKDFVVDFVLAKIYHKTKPVYDEMLQSRHLFISKNINFTELVNEYTIGSIAKKYDAIIIGSDMVWSSMGKKYLIHLFDWEPEFEGLRFSYAACASYENVPNINRKKAKKLFKKFDALSVRDNTTSNLVYNAAGINPLIVADPTLLYDFKNFIGSAQYNESYIFVYILGDRIKGKGSHNTVISQIQEKYGKQKIIAIVMSEISIDAESFADKVIYNASPEDWINLIYYARFVYTDSFHGCIFSLKYKKQFLAYYTYAVRATRLLDLSKRYKLDKYIVSSIADMTEKKSIVEPIQYNTIDPVINKHIADSKQFLFELFEPGNL